LLVHACFYRAGRQEQGGPRRTQGRARPSGKIAGPAAWLGRGFSETWYDDEAELRRDNMTFGNISKRFYFEEIAVKPRR
jgi:hypothetical protein